MNKILNGSSNEWMPRKKLDKKNRRKKYTILNHVRYKYYDMCYVCGKTNSKENPHHAHHWKEHAQYPLIRYIPVNHILLCKDCHESLHKHFNYKPINTVKEQWEYVRTNRELCLHKPLILTGL